MVAALLMTECISYLINAKQRSMTAHIDYLKRTYHVQLMSAAQRSGPPGRARRIIPPSALPVVTGQYTDQRDRLHIRLLWVRQ
jgi:hypothetical protein